MTKKDYTKIADVLGYKLQQVRKWKNTEAQSLSLAYIEDFMTMLEEDNTRFDRTKFVGYINKHYSDDFSQLHTTYMGHVVSR